MKKQTHPRHVQVAAVIFSQLMIVFAAVLVYPSLLQPTKIQTFAATPITLTSISVSNITISSFTLNWVTNVPATSQVQYSAWGTKFDISTPVDQTMTTTHAVTVSGLDPSTLYYIRAVSTDGVGGIGKAQDDLSALTLFDKTAPVDFDLVNPSSPSHVFQGSYALFSVRARQLGGASNLTIKYTFDNVPPGITVSAVDEWFGVESLRVTAAPNAPVGNYSFQVTGTYAAKAHSIILPLIVDPAPVRVTPQPYINPPPAIPQLALWESNMKKYGTKHCNQSLINLQGTWDGSVWFYDGIRVYYQMAEYLKDPVWATTCAQYVKAVYRSHVFVNNGAIQGYRVFTRGLLLDWQKTGDADSLNAVNLLAKNGARGNTALSSNINEFYSREAAYAIDAKMDNETAGFGAMPLLADQVTSALGHLDQWFQTGNYYRIAPFMFALTTNALMDYEKKTGDLRILPGIQRGADYIWANMWRGTGFCYQDFQDHTSCTTAAPDLNLLIAPTYCWLYEKTGDPKYLTQGDQIFAAGVQYAWLDQGKPFSQNYRLSFDYVACRQRVGAVHSAASSSAASSLSSSSASSSLPSSSSSSSSIPFVQASSSSLPTGSVSSWSRSSLSSSSNEKALREKALADYLAAQAALKAAASSTSSSLNPRRQMVLKTPSELTSSSGFLAKTINSTQVIFKDVFITDYFAPAVDILVDLNIVSGYNDANGKPLGLYRPSRDVQYAEVAKMLAQLMNLSGSTPVNASAQNTWAAPFVAALEAKSPSLYTKDLNVFTPMTRGQVIHAMADILGVQPDPRIGVFFSDTSDPLINTFKGMGIVKGNPDGTFRPNSPINRAEVATLLGRLLEQGYGS
ncbi:MAG: S-layer homology domain-containing protein [Candidatus Peribacteraceae bacterium]|nr:S-layer homology domain-containing protein [Candidatus Peribacteraceae bacterium]